MARFVRCGAGLSPTGKKQSPGKKKSRRGNYYTVMLHTIYYSTDTHKNLSLAEASRQDFATISVTPADGCSVHAANQSAIFCALDYRDDQDDSPDELTGDFSDFFLETFPECFPNALAEELFQAFRSHVHRYRHCFDRPAKSPRNSEIESAIRNKGQDGSHVFDRDGWKFVLRQFQSWMFSPDNLGRKLYYTSGGRIAILYLDGDTHLAFQSPEDGLAAQAIIEEEFRSRLGITPPFLGSERGRNGYLKVDVGHAEPEEANQVFDELQEAIRLLFAKHGNLADFEIKGTLTWLDKAGTLHAGRYGKLPTSSPDWTYRWQHNFMRTRPITLEQVKDFISQIKASVTEEDVRRHELARHNAFVSHYLPLGPEQEAKLAREFGSWWVEETMENYRSQKWIARTALTERMIDKLWRDYEPEIISAEREEDAEPVAAEANNPSTVTTPVAGCSQKALDEIKNEPDSLKRQHEALMMLARRLKRVPTLDEALAFIKLEGLFTGSWQQNARRRKARVKGILRFITRTFNAAKCKNGSVNVGKYTDWAAKKFPNGIVGGMRKCLTLEGDVYEVQQRISVSPQFIAVFMAVCEHALIQDKNGNDAFPHERAKKLWETLYAKRCISVKFCGRKWAICREAMVRYGIVKITDRNYCHGKAMKWNVGDYFPFLGGWKTPKQPSLLPAVDLVEFLREKNNVRDREHNTLLHQQCPKMTSLGLLQPSRPPP